MTERGLSKVGVGAAAALSWTLPLAVLAVTGLAERALPTDELFRWPALFPGSGLAVGALGLFFGGVAFARSRDDASTRRRALLGSGASLALLVVVGLAYVSGKASGSLAEADLRRLTEAALRDSPGWNGGAFLDGARIFAFEIDPGSELGKALAREHGRPYRVVLFGTDNAAGEREAVVELTGARALHAGGAVTTTAIPSRPVRVAPGDRVDGASSFFASDDSFRDVSAIEIHVNGAPRRIPGRYFTLEEKRAIDAARAQAQKGQP